MRRLLPLFICFTTAALAKDFWLQPTSYRVAVGAAVPVRLLVGTGLAGETWPRPTRRTQRFVRLGPTDSTDLRPALLADSVAPLATCPSPGTHVLVLVSAPAFVELPAAEFTAYLREAGLDAALLYRRQQGQSTTTPGREAYRRCAKALVLATLGPHDAPTPADTAYRRVLGLPLELVPEQNPYRLRAGAALTVRVLRAGQPVPGALVQVWDASPLAGGQPLATPSVPSHFATRANNNGRALLRLPGRGPYLVAASVIEAAPAALASRADWLSTWATLTFAGPAGQKNEHNRYLYK
ncbi:MAG: DUF4198 domain-containing protein [Janthinobacterium lividum]